jgi:hypothetical protein
MAVTLLPQRTEPGVSAGPFASLGKDAARQMPGGGFVR